MRGVPLKAGLHEITLTVVQGNAPGKLKLEWKKGHGPHEKTPVPAEAYRH